MVVFLKHPSREELEAEVARLRGVLAQAGIDPQPSGHWIPTASGTSTVHERTQAPAARLALEPAHERYRLAFKATNDAIWDWDLVSNHVLWNDALEEAYGHCLAQADSTGDWWIARIHPDDRARIEASIHAVIDGDGSAWADGYRFQRQDGSYAEVLDRGHVI
ncbi:MAG: sensory box histidine kinase/response regulator, partial [Pseudomonas sp.]|nr:sensory box histidine kinase/response regulator [Pseudomonas sp.]